MRGFVTSKKDRKGWYPVLSLPGNKKKWLRRCTTKREADKLLAMEVAKYHGSSWYVTSSVSFEVFAERWLQCQVDGGRKPSTLAGYAVTLRAHSLPAFVGLRVDRVTPSIVQSFITTRLKAGMNPSTLNRIVRQLHAIFQQARRWGYVSDNPVSLVERPRSRQRAMDYLQPEEVLRFLEAVPEHRRLLFKTAVLTGLRIGELLAMKWEHLDRRSGRYHVIESLWRGKGGWQLVSPKSDSSRRSVKLPVGLLAEFCDYHATYLKNRETLGNDYQDIGLIFCQTNGRPLDAGNLLNRDFRRTLNRAGLRRIRIHDLRHTFAALMIAQGEHPKTIQDAMGHSSIAVTMNTYGHLLPRLREEAANRLEASLLAHGSTE